MGDLDPGLRESVRDARVARLATVRPDRRPHVVAITFALADDTIVSAIDHKPKRTTNVQRLKNIEAHPVASVIIDHYDDDWTRLWWVRADGAAQVVTEGAVRQEAIERLVAKYEPYRERPPQGPVIIVAVEQWISWSA